MNVFGTSDSKYDSHHWMSDVAFRTAPPIGGPFCYNITYDGRLLNNWVCSRVALLLFERSISFIHSFEILSHNESDFCLGDIFAPFLGPSNKHCSNKEL